MMQRLAIWFEASRPKTLFIGIAPVLIGASMAYQQMPIQWLTLLHILLTAVGIQIGTNLANDYFDFKKGTDTEERLGPRRVCQSGLVSQREILSAILIAFGSATISSLHLISLGGWMIGAMMAIAILLGIGYTAGPFPLGYLGLGEAIVFFVFGPVATMMTFFLLTSHFSLASILAGIAPGCFAAAIINMNNMRDVEGDKRSGKRSIPVRFGIGFSKAFFISMLIIACLCPLMQMFLGLSPMKTAIGLTPLLLLPSLCREVLGAREGRDFIPLFPKAIRIQFLYSLIAILGGIV